MLTLSVLYLICYILTLVLLFIFLKTNKLLKCANKFSFTAFISYVNIYVNDSILFKFLLAHLSGVAPAFLFYLKFNFLITVLHQTHFFLFVLFF